MSNGIRYHVQVRMISVIKSRFPETGNIDPKRKACFVGISLNVKWKAGPDRVRPCFIIVPERLKTGFMESVSAPHVDSVRDPPWWYWWIWDA